MSLHNLTAIEQALRGRDDTGKIAVAVEAGVCGPSRWSIGSGSGDAASERVCRWSSSRAWWAPSHTRGLTREIMSGKRYGYATYTVRINFVLSDSRLDWPRGLVVWWCAPGVWLRWSWSAASLLPGPPTKLRFRVRGDSQRQHQHSLKYGRIALSQVDTVGVEPAYTTYRRVDLDLRSSSDTLANPGRALLSH